MEEQPEALLGKHTPKHNREIERLKTRLAEIEKDIADATNLLGKLPISQLEAKLTALVRDQDTLKGELEAATHKLLSATNAPNAFADIRAAVLKLDKAKTKQAEGEAMYDFDQAARVLLEQLADNETRKKVLALLPSLVQRLEMDFPNSNYRIVSASGQVSAWRHIIKMDAMLRKYQAE